MLSLRHRNGQVRFHCVAQPAARSADTPPFVLGHGIDVDGEDGRREQAACGDAAAESILESVGDGIYGVDMEGQIIFVNEVARG